MVAPSGEGAARCMRQALATVKIPIDYINPHATSTPVGDLKEIEALREVFGSGDKCPPISATKSLTGHSQGATGVHEAIYSLLMMRNGFICESAHIDEIDPAFADMPIVRERRDNVQSARRRSPIPSASAAPTRRSCSSTSTRDALTNFSAAAKQTPPENLSRTSVHESGLMSGKRGLVMGVANDHSIAWGIAKALAAEGAELAFTYQGEALGKRVPRSPKASARSSSLPATSRTSRSVDAVFRRARRGMGQRSTSSSTASASPTATS